MISFSNQMSGMSVAASDGDIGTVADVLFDVLRWRVLYLQVSTGWLFGRHVIVPVEKVVSVDIPGGPVHMALTRDEIEASPAAASFGSLEQSYEKELLGYYGLSQKTRAETARLPPLSHPPGQPAAEAAASRHRPPMPASEIDGYRLDADGSIVGTVRDLVIDVDSWRIISCTAEVGGFLVPEMAEVGIGPVTGIDREAQVLHTSIPKDQVERLPRLGEDDTPYVFPQE